MAKAKSLTVSKKFCNCLAPLSKAEFTELEKQVVAAGRVNDPIVVWKNVILDGHHRYKIAEKHGLPFEVVEMEFDSDAHAVIWMIENQVGRRQLEGEHRETAAMNLADSYSTTGYGAHVMERIADVFGVKRNAVHAWITAARARRKIHPTVAKKIKSGEVKVAQKDIVKLAELPLEKQDALVKKAAKNKVAVRTLLPASTPTKKKESKPGATSTSPGPAEPVEVDLLNKPIKKAFEKDFAETCFDEIMQHVIDIREIAKKRASKGSRGKWFALSNVLELLESLEHETLRATPYTTCPECDGKKCNQCRNSGIVPQYVIVDRESRNA